MKRVGLGVAGGAILAALLVGLPSAGQAAWWKFGARHTEAHPPDDPAGSPPLVQAAQAEDSDRLSRIEAQIRSLTGQIEELAFQLRQLQDQMKRAQEDNEFRFKELEAGTAGTSSDTAKADGAEAPHASGDQPAGAAAPAIVIDPAADGGSLPTETPPADAIGNLADNPPPVEEAPAEGPGAPPRPLGTLTLDGPPPAEEGPLDLSSMAAGGSEPAGEAAVAAIAPSGDPRSDYETAYDKLLRGDYSLAEAGFRLFLSTYPSDPLAPDAQYWLGESYFARGKYREAANEFLAGYKAYPKSSKGADTLFKLGASLAGLGERDAACQTYAKVLKQYPQLSNAMRQRVKTEQASASC